MFGIWLGDAWRLNDRFTLNLGIRYDVAWNDFIAPGLEETELVFDTGFSVENIGYRNDIRDLDNVAPRAGFVWDTTGNADFIIRGGVGMYYSTQGGNQVIDAQLFNGQARALEHLRERRAAGLRRRPDAWRQSRGYLRQAWWHCPRRAFR